MTGASAEYSSMKPLVAGVLGLAALVALGGCGSDGPLLVPVSGTVTLDGRPLVHKTIQLIPEEGTPGQGAGATTDQNGHYQLLAVRPGATSDLQGVPPGKYRVVVTEPMFPIEASLPNASTEDGEPAPAIGVPSPGRRARGQNIPRAYTTRETTPLRADVSGEGGVIDLKLTSNP